MNTLPLERSRLQQLIPHAGAMCLLDRVVEYSDQHILCETASHRDPANPLRRELGLAALHLAEYAAQAAAAHGALQAGGRAQPGMLAALREVKLHAEHVQDIPGDLRVRARRQLARPEGLLYDFEIRSGDRVLCEGRIAISLAV